MDWMSGGLMDIYLREIEAIEYLIGLLIFNRFIVFELIRGI